METRTHTYTQIQTYTHTHTHTRTRAHAHLVHNEPQGGLDTIDGYVTLWRAHGRVRVAKVFRAEDAHERAGTEKPGEGEGRETKVV